MLHCLSVHWQRIDAQRTGKELSLVQVEAIMDNGDLEKGFEPLKSSGVLKCC